MAHAYVAVAKDGGMTIVVVGAAAVVVVVGWAPR
jgi:hypothetical protein